MWTSCPRPIRVRVRIRVNVRFKVEVKVRPSAAGPLTLNVTPCLRPLHPSLASRPLPQALAPGVTSFVIDSECVAFDREKGTILPFQKIQSRARKVHSG